MVVFLVPIRFSSGRWWIFFNNKKYYGFKLFWNITKLRILWLKSFKICPLFVTWTARCASLIRHSLDHRLRLTSSTKSPKPKIFRVLINITIFYGRNFLPYQHEMLRKGSHWELNYLFVVFALRRPYFNWKVLCFERVMHYFETQVPPLTPLTLLKRQKIEWTTKSFNFENWVKVLSNFYSIYRFWVLVCQRHQRGYKEGRRRWVEKMAARVLVEDWERFPSQRDSSIPEKEPQS